MHSFDCCVAALLTPLYGVFRGFKRGERALESTGQERVVKTQPNGRLLSPADFHGIIAQVFPLSFTGSHLQHTLHTWTIFYPLPPKKVFKFLVTNPNISNTFKTLIKQLHFETVECTLELFPVSGCSSRRSFPGIVVQSFSTSCTKHQTSSKVGFCQVSLQKKNSQPGPPTPKHAHKKIRTHARNAEGSINSPSSLPRRQPFCNITHQHSYT